MKRLPKKAESELLAIMRRQGSLFDEKQAGLDLAGIISRFPALKAQQGGRAGRHQSDARILAEIAAEPYHHHTGHQPGRTVKDKLQSGIYPQFIAALARAGGIEVNVKRSLINAGKRSGP